MPCRVVESSTPGHYHLYIDQRMRWGEYKDLLKALHKAGLIESGFYDASIRNHATMLRPPWVRTWSAAPGGKPGFMRQDRPLGAGHLRDSVTSTSASRRSSSRGYDQKPGTKPHRRRTRRRCAVATLLRDPRAAVEHPDNLSGQRRRARVRKGYGACVIFFAQVWAEEMEERMATGASLADIASASSHYADNIMGRWGVTGFQYGAVISVLSQVWEHGEELRQWHNLDTQMGTEGEEANEDGTVLNPALIVMKPRES